MKVLIAVDNSDCAEKTFDWYIANGHKADNEVFVCHEAEQPDLPTSSYTMGGAFLAAEEMNSIMAAHHKKCKDLQHKYKEKCQAVKNLNYKVIVEATHSSIGHGIIHQAEKLGVDMIVIGTRGHGMLRRTVLGSVSDYVLHHAKVPVMIYHK